MSSPAVYSTAIVGLGPMHKHHLRALTGDTFRLVAACDRDPGRLAEAELPDDAAGYTDLDRMMGDIRPDVVVVTTPDATHCAVVECAVVHGPKAVVCEKPLSLHYADGVRMVEMCRQHGTELIVNHQRRLLTGLAGRRALSEGCVGELLELEARCPGQLLSDGTHGIDLLQCLVHDALPDAVCGMVCYPKAIPVGRYGYPPDESACAAWFPGDRTRCVVHTGRLARRASYMEVRVRGAKGELWLPGDQLPEWYISDGGPGTHRMGLDANNWYPTPVPARDGGPWRRLDDSLATPCSDLSAVYRILAQRLAGSHSAPHPLEATTALGTLAIANAACLSALRREPVTLPLPRETIIPFAGLSTRCTASASPI